MTTTTRGCPATQYLLDAVRERARDTGVAADVDVIARNATDQQARSEFWWWLMLVVLGMLVFEVVMTRRLVQGGHILIEPEAA